MGVWYGLELRAIAHLFHIIIIIGQNIVMMQVGPSRTSFGNGIEDDSSYSENILQSGEMDTLRLNIVKECRGWAKQMAKALQGRNNLRLLTRDGRKNKQMSSIQYQQKQKVIENSSRSSIQCGNKLPNYNQAICQNLLGKSTQRQGLRGLEKVDEDKTKQKIGYAKKSNIKQAIIKYSNTVILSKQEIVEQATKNSINQIELICVKKGRQQVQKQINGKTLLKSHQNANKIQENKQDNESCEMDELQTYDKKFLIVKPEVWQKKINVERAKCIQNHQQNSIAIQAKYQIKSIKSLQKNSKNNQHNIHQIKGSHGQRLKQKIMKNLKKKMQTQNQDEKQPQTKQLNLPTLSNSHQLEPQRPTIETKRAHKSTPILHLPYIPQAKQSGRVGNGNCQKRL